MKDISCNHCFANLAVDSRMKIFIFLKDNGAKTVSEIVKQTSLSQPTISYHLKSMSDAGLLSKQREGKEIFYKVNKDCPNNKEICMLKQMDFTN
jgi:ArsR family transcriptional regulator